MADFPPISAMFTLEPEVALAIFQSKGLQLSFAWQDMVAEEHAKAFTVAKMMQVDLLSDVREALDIAIEQGQTLQSFMDEIIPILTKTGWWGRKEITDPKTGKTIVAQLGSARRLELIFRTNLQTSYAAGHWQQIEANKTTQRWLMYDAVDDTRTRPEHRKWDGLILPVDHPFWATHAPQNGWNCRCGLIQLSDFDLAQEGLTPSKSPRIKRKTWTNPRTGKKRRVPEGIDPGWDYNPGKAGADRVKALLGEKIDALPADMRDAAKNLLDD